MALLKFRLHALSTAAAIYFVVIVLCPVSCYSLWMQKAGIYNICTQLRHNILHFSMNETSISNAKFTWFPQYSGWVVELASFSGVPAAVVSLARHAAHLWPSHPFCSWLLSSLWALASFPVGTSNSQLSNKLMNKTQTLLYTVNHIHRSLFTKGYIHPYVIHVDQNLSKILAQQHSL